MKFRLVIVAAISLAISGCTHSTNFDLNVSNSTATPQSLTVTFQKAGSDEIAFEQTWSSIAPNSSQPSVKVRIKPGEYTIKANAGILNAERIDGLGTSIVAVSVGIRTNEIIIGVGRV